MSNKKPVLKFIFAGFLIAVLMAAALIVFFLVSLFSEPDMSDLPSFYPFKSEKARRIYLDNYDRRARKWPVPSQTKIVETYYGRTFVRMSGPADAPPLVLLPSASSHSLLWTPNIKALSDSFRVYAVDNIYDFGRSVNTKAIKSSGDLTNWLDELFSALDLGHGINLMGLSFGGWLTSRYALEHPQRLRRSVWLAPAATLFEFPGEWAWRGILSAVPHRYFMQKFMVGWLFEDLLNSKDDYKRGLLDDMVNDAVLGLKCFRFRMPVTPTVLDDKELQGIKVPTLFLVGENEKLYPAQKAVDRLNRAAPQIKTEIISNAGHDLTLVQADIVNARILEFLKGDPDTAQ
jgi:pimeloyl-ACP methyl ester carboxylesterase